MTSRDFPKLFGIIVNLREFSLNDAEDIARLMSYNVSKYLYEVPNPYTIEDAINFIKLLIAISTPLRLYILQ
jgi:hypothetical protein